jgi:predicted RND superfamily exporter protein
MSDFVDTILHWFESTNLLQQIKDVDYQGLFTNPWFLVPFVAFILYLLYRQAFRDLVIVAIVVGVWWVSGLEYMHTMVVNGHLQMNKVLPVLFGGAGVLALLIYMLFGRSD